MKRKATLILLAKARSQEEAINIENGRSPRTEYFALERAIHASVCDYNDVLRSTHPFVRIARSRGLGWGLAALGFTRRHQFEQFYVTGEDIGIPFGLMMRATGDLGRITMLVHHCGTPRRRKILKTLGDAIWRNVIVLASRQWEILTQEIGYPTYKVHFFRQWLDERFFRQEISDDGGYMFSCGVESRDYATFLQAATTVPHRFRVVASGWAPFATFRVAEGIESSSKIDVQSNISFDELREAYAQARVVVLPLKEVDYAAGVTGICEAMAMGKAIVATDSPGIRDYIRHQTSGLVVPVGNPELLGRAISELWRDPERCARMGAHNRSWIENAMTLDRYVERVAGLLGSARSRDVVE